MSDNIKFGIVIVGMLFILGSCIVASVDTLGNRIQRFTAMRDERVRVTCESVDGRDYAGCKSRIYDDIRRERQR